jgi:hypothetical protein
MTLGLRVILLIAAVAIFVIAIFVSVEHEFDWIAAGLALTTAAVLVRDLGWADRTIGGMTGRQNP